MSAKVTQLRVVNGHAPGNAAIARQLRALADEIDREGAEPIDNVVSIVAAASGDLPLYIAGAAMTHVNLAGLLAFAQQKAMLA